MNVNYVKQLLIIAANFTAKIVEKQLLQRFRPMIGAIVNAKTRFSQEGYSELKVFQRSNKGSKM